MPGAGYQVTIDLHIRSGLIMSRSDPCSPFAASSAVPTWRRRQIARVEDLSDAVYRAGLEAMQMSRAPVTRSLAFAEHDGVVYSSGLIGGRVALAGPLSESMITFGVGLKLVPGSRHWLNEVATGDFGIFLPGDDHDALYMSGSLYATATLTAERLEAAAERIGLVLDARALGGSGVHPRPVARSVLAGLRTRFEQVHAGLHGASAAALGGSLLDAVIAHIGRPPRRPIGRTDPRGHARSVARARDYVLEHLEQPLSIDAIAAAASTSRRTLHRAFNHVLDETPQSYVRKLRLHRIRRDLATDAEIVCTIALLSNRWGISELGRLSGWYRDLFGEMPSETLAQRRRDAASPPAGARRLARSA
jgi:AraC-like DNA-binding protein